MIITPEARALLKRMDADDAIDKAVELALEAAKKVCNEHLVSEIYDDWHDGYNSAAWSIRAKIGALKDGK